MQVPPFSLEKQLSTIGTELDAAVLRVLHSGQYIGGLEIQSFENSFSEYVGTRNVVGCNSGTDALILALRALDIAKGDEVITSSFSFFATAEAISNVGATPVFVDIEPNGFSIDIDLIERAITSKTKAILPVHLFGCPVNMTRVKALADKYDLKIIEDCAQAAGAKWDGKSVGSLGDIGCFSFFPTKNLGAAGDGGAVTTNNDELAKRMRELAIHGMPRRYLHNELGYNSRLDALQAAILNIKLPRLGEYIAQRKKVAMRYITSLEGLDGIEICNYPNQNEINHGWNQFVIRVINYRSKSLDSKKNNEFNATENTIDLVDAQPRDLLKYDLEKLGVKTIIYYPIPIHLQPAYKYLGHKLGYLTRTEKACSQVLSLPIFPEITNEEQDYVIKAIKKLLNQSIIHELASPMPGGNSFSI